MNFYELLTKIMNDPEYIRVKEKLKREGKWIEVTEENGVIIKKLYVTNQ